jgi:DNA-binding LacI/PurR family transcriptional regulator
MTTIMMDNTEPQPTLMTIARVAGVSQSTVSRALGSAPSMVNPRTKAHIIETALRLGYRPRRRYTKVFEGINVVGYVVLPRTAVLTQQDALNLLRRMRDLNGDGRVQMYALIPVQVSVKI